LHRSRYVYINFQVYISITQCFTHNSLGPLARETHCIYIIPLEKECHNSEKAHFELRPQEVCLRPYLPSGIASHVYFLKWPREGRSVVILMRFQRPGQWFYLFPEKLYFSSGDGVLLGVWYIHIIYMNTEITVGYIYELFMRYRVMCMSMRMKLY
jgi:hypothetical protein